MRLNLTLLVLPFVAYQSERNNAKLVDLQRYMLKRLGTQVSIPNIFLKKLHITLRYHFGDYYEYTKWRMLFERQVPSRNILFFLACRSHRSPRPEPESTCTTSSLKNAFS